jgi:hypothetical protein
MNGVPFTGAKHLGSSGTACCKRVPRPPASMMASILPVIWLVNKMLQLHSGQTVQECDATTAEKHYQSRVKKTGYHFHRFLFIVPENKPLPPIRK